MRHYEFFLDHCAAFRLQIGQLSADSRTRKLTVVASLVVQLRRFLLHDSYTMLPICSSQLSRLSRKYTQPESSSREQTELQTRTAVQPSWEYSNNSVKPNFLLFSQVR